ncbi:MAG: glycoside hydrolase family 140 protein [Bacteroidales bacterium]
MKKLIFCIAIIALSNLLLGQTPWEKGKLMVSENSRYLKHENGDPFFWLGDTGWLLFQRLNRDEVKKYFENRKEKDFNVILCIFLQFFHHTNAYGDSAFVNGDMSLPAITQGNDPNDATQYDYWDHVDYMVDLAAQYGIYMAIAPTWSHLVFKDTSITAEKAELFAAHIANHFKDKPNIIWINGGSSKGERNTEIWEIIGTTIKKNDPNHLMTFHPFGRMQSSTWFNNSSWLDVNMFVSGHRNYTQDNTPTAFGEDNWRYAMNDLSKIPLRPTLDGEPSYESLPQGLHDPTMPYWSASDVRRYAYWSVLAGSCGHVYGQNSVRQVYIQGVNKAESGAKLSFFEALDDEGSFQMQYLKDLILSRPYFDRVNDQSVVAGDEGEKYDRIMVSRGKDYLMAYTYTGREFTVQMGKISGKKVNAWWYDTRTGEATKIGEYDNTGSVRFDPPGAKYNGNDWVLVLDNISKTFNKPGSIVR